MRALFGGLLLVALVLAAPTAEFADKIVVNKSKRELLLLRNGKAIHTYRIALGRNPVGPKRRQGDGKTPEGSYSISGRNAKSAFHRSLRISYPNDADRERARREGVNVEPLRAIPAFINDFKIPFPVVACYPLEPERIVDDEKARSHCGILQAIKTVPASRLGFPVVGFPLTLLIDRAGRLSRVFYGYGGAFQDRVLDRDVRQLLNERS